MRFTYDAVKTELKNSSFFWERNFNQIEEVIAASDISIVYPMSYKNDTGEESRVLFFSQSEIYSLQFKDGRAFTLTSLGTENIVKISLDIQGTEKATLHIQFHDEEIEVTSSDSIYQYQIGEVINIIIRIASMYSK